MASLGLLKDRVQQLLKLRAVTCVIDSFEPGSTTGVVCCSMLRRGLLGKTKMKAGMLNGALGLVSYKGHCSKQMNLTSSQCSV